MVRILAAWLTTASMAKVMKSMKEISTIGFSPDRAAPTAIPTIAASEIGVSRTRSPPNLSRKPRVAPQTPPAPATSSPNSTKVGSAAMASAIARLTAWL
jgi:hypothetical protein